MAKTFYTERDVEDLNQRGVKTLDINDDIVLTELAYEKAEKFGIKLIDTSITIPYSQKQTTEIVETRTTINPMNIIKDDKVDLKQRVKDAVINRIGNQVDPAMLDKIIERVLNNTNLK